MIVCRLAAMASSAPVGGQVIDTPSKRCDMTAVAESTSLLAPSRLVAETRVDFRCAALESLDRAGDHGATLLAIDMSETRDVDASGLGILVLVQKRARERGLRTRLLHTQHSVRSLLTLTKLDGLFEFA